MKERRIIPGLFRHKSYFQSSMGMAICLSASFAAQRLALGEDCLSKKGRIAVPTQKRSLGALSGTPFHMGRYYGGKPVINPF
jgi:hypothetical protein